MKKMLTLISIIMLCTGCAINKDDPSSEKKTVSNAVEATPVECTTSPVDITFQAIVISKSDTNLMVVAAEAGKGFAIFDPINVSVPGSQVDVSLGDMVEIGYNGTIAESYPCQIGADSVKIKEKANNNWPATSGIPEDYSIEEAVQDNCVVMSLDKVESKDRLLRFIENTKSGMIGYLRSIYYSDEGDVLITDIIYDGNKYYVFEDNTRDKFAGTAKVYKKEYQHINTYEKEGNKIVYLADRNDITIEEYDRSQVSSNEEDLIDSFLLYYELAEIAE